mmetsp:Transcript_1990/g.6364  ORF Transcript_1990/g.6364 Transcript_1990/m.6364 type:complete len:239 (-) Transcript_1990:1033-1749(-)
MREARRASAALCRSRRRSAMASLFRPRRLRPRAGALAPASAGVDEARRPGMLPIGSYTDAPSPPIARARPFPPAPTADFPPSASVPRVTARAAAGTGGARPHGAHEVAPVAPFREPRWRPARGVHAYVTATPRAPCGAPRPPLRAAPKRRPPKPKLEPLAPREAPRALERARAGAARAAASALARLSQNQLAPADNASAARRARASARPWRPCAPTPRGPRGGRHYEERAPAAEPLRG